jgi:hypothetical protein
MRVHELYLSLVARNARAKELKAKGYSVMCRTANGQNLHPQYVVDYRKDFQTGFGNTDYKTYFSKLYIVETLN